MNKMACDLRTNSFKASYYCN